MFYQDPETGLREQVGIVSWLKPGCRGAPGVYMRVAYFYDWIKQIMDEYPN